MKNYKFKVCTVVEGKSLKAFLSNLKEVQKENEMIELRADLITNLKEKDTSLLKRQTKIPAIFKALKPKIIQEAFDEGFDFVDVAYGNPIINTLKKNQKKHLLLSYHNFNNTPELKALKNQLNRMRKTSPAMIKIATMVNNDKDIINLMKLLKQKRKKEKLILIGMGNLGQITRIIFPLSGSYLTYASMDDSNIAPGILPIKTMKEIYGR